MTKILITTLLFLNFAFSIEIQLENAQTGKLEKSIELNSQVIQLSTSKQSLMAQLDGKIMNYYVKEGDLVKKGDKIALIQSIELSKMSAEYLSLKEQLRSIEDNYEGSLSLSKKDIVSKQELNLLNIQRRDTHAKLETLISQLKTLGIEVKNLKNTISQYTLYAYNSGIVSAILKPEYSSISKQDELISIVKENSFYLKSYLPVMYSQYLKVGQKISTNLNGKNIITYIEKILPELDSSTQRIIVLSNIEDENVKLYSNLYLGSTLYYESDNEYILIKKSALSFMDNEWIIFIPDEVKIEEFKPVQIKIIDENEEYVAIEGLENNQKYVSDEPYKIKSIALKSSIGEE